MTRFSILLGRVGVAALAAASAAIFGTVASAAVPKLLLRLPIPEWPPAPMTPLIAFAIFGSMLLGVPVYVIAAMRGGWSRLGHLAYGLSVPVIAVVGIVAASPPARAVAGTHVYDMLWIALTELVPGGAVAGLVAHAVSETGEHYRERLDAWLSARAGE